MDKRNLRNRFNLNFKAFANFLICYLTKIKQTVTQYLYKFTINSPVTQHKSTLSTHTGQRVHAVYLWSISVSEQVILGHCSCLVTRLQTRKGRGGSHQEQTACPLSFNPISSLWSCFLHHTLLTPWSQLSSRRIQQPRFWNRLSELECEKMGLHCYNFTTFINQKTRDDIPSATGANSIFAAFLSVFPSLANNNTCIRMLFF